MSSFLEMPNSASEESSADEVLSEDGSRARRESLTAIRLRDTKTGKFVAGAGLVTKRRFSVTSFKGVAEGITAGSIGGIVANQFPQNRSSSKKALKKAESLDPKLSVKLKKIKEK